MVGTSAFAAFYIVQDSGPKRCTITESRPTTVTSVRGRGMSWQRVNALFALPQLGVDAGELRVQVRAQTFHHGDDHQGNAGRYEAVFDCCRAGLVLGETPE